MRDAPDLLRKGQRTGGELGTFEVHNPITTIEIEER
jgi:hypothetical protein